MSYRYNLDDFEHVYFLGKLEKERKITDFRENSTLLKVLFLAFGEYFKKTGQCSRRHKGSYFRSTRTKKHVYCPFGIKDRRIKSIQMANQFLAEKASGYPNFFSGHFK